MPQTYVKPLGTRDPNPYLTDPRSTPPPLCETLTVNPHPRFRYIESPYPRPRFLSVKVLTPTYATNPIPIPGPYSHPGLLSL